MKHSPGAFKNSLSLVLAACLQLAGLTAGAEVVLTGLDDAQALNANAFLKLDDLGCEAPAWEIESLTRAAPGQIADALEALGHYRATVTIVDDSAGRDCWRKAIEVVPGPPTTYDQVEVAVLGDGADNPEIRALLASSPLTPGATLNHGQYSDFKRRLRSLAAERGYFDAEVVASEVVVDKDLRHARVKLVIESGPRYRFGAVDFGEPLLEASVYQTLLALRQGEPYDARAIANTHRNFLESGYFGFVNVVADPAAAQDLSVPVKIDATAAKARVYSGGLGFATDIGPRFQLNYRNRRINRRGHSLNGKLQWSAVQSLLGMEYRLPYGDDRRDALSLRGGAALEDTATSESKTFDVALRLTRALGKGWLRSTYVDARREFYKISDQDSSSTLVIPGVIWSKVTQKTNPRPAKGHRLSFELRGTSNALGSDTTFVQARADAKHIKSFGERMRLLSRLTLGTTAKDTLRELPPSARFFAGGDGSVRGYAYESIGPRDANDAVIGGGNLITASVELDYRLSESWAVATFVDTGSAFNDTDVDFNTGIGLGVRWLTAVGPVRLDVASPLDLDRSVRLHISIGGDL